MSLKLVLPKFSLAAPKKLSYSGPYAYGKTYVNESYIALTIE